MQLGGADDKLPRTTKCVLDPAATFSPGGWYSQIILTRKRGKCDFNFHMNDLFMPRTLLSVSTI